MNDLGGVMEFSNGCPTCEFVGSDARIPAGVNCGGCGHHFHVGLEMLAQPDPIACPRCDASAKPSEIAPIAKEAVERAEKAVAEIEAGRGVPR